MKSNHIFMCIGNIDEKFIEEAAPKKFKPSRKISIKRVLPFAACLCIIIAVTFGFYLNNQNRLSLLTNLSHITFDSMGYEGIDSNALLNSTDINPYSEELLPKSLPVFKNSCYSGGLYQNYFSEKDLQNNLKKFLENFEENEIQFSTMKAEIDTDDPNYKENLIYNVFAETEQFRISTNGHGFSITPKSKKASFDLTAYLEANYDTENTGKYQTYSVDGELLSTSYKVYKKSDSTAENILNFNLSSAEIHLKDDGSIDFVIIDDYLNSSEKITDYETIPLEKATVKLLLGADVSTSTPEELIIGGKVQKEHIVKTDLIYYTGNLQQAFIPYYRFYVKLINPDESSDIENYGLFYVPAVEIIDNPEIELLKNFF